MVTHITKCVVCEGDAYCSSDTHALGCGEGGCYSDGPVIEFCSEECFRALYAKMLLRWKIYTEIQREEWKREIPPLAPLGP